MLTQKRLKEFLDYTEVGIFTWRVARTTWIYVGDRAGSPNDKGYRVIKIDDKSYKEHRLAFLYMNGKWPTYQVDHINEIKDDNRWCNLREANQPQNSANRGKNKNNTSGYKGVIWHKRDQTWQAQIRVNGKTVFLGSFFSKQEAHAAYCAAAEKYFGEFSQG
jgi:hypothetical protein